MTGGRVFLADGVAQGVPMRLEAARRAQQAGDIGSMTHILDEVLAGQPTHFDAGLMRAEAEIHAGRYAVAREMLERMEALAAGNPSQLLRVAEFHSHLHRPLDAERCCAKALALSPAHPRARYDLAVASLALGRMDRAESLFDALIADDPDDADAWVNRSTLRRATPDSNHVAALQERLQGSEQGGEGRIALGYALAKELEDLGHHDDSFRALGTAADARRRRLSYRVEDDVSTIEAIIGTFSAARLAQVKASLGEPGPIFVLGLPRSGTTLVDRILSSHSEVESLGEVQDFALALTGSVKGVRTKQEFVRRSATIDHAALGEAYLGRIAGRGAGAAMAIDKTPLNILYIGLIALSIPTARIVHVRRGAMDGCFAMYKTLFRMGYPFSYDLNDLAAYRIAYERLMAHWRAVLPNRMVEIDYEELVTDQAARSRYLIDACGLSWESRCLDFHVNPAPVTTASAAQVRSPIHDRSVGLWRRHATGLAPLAEALTRAGIALEARR